MCSFVFRTGRYAALNRVASQLMMQRLYAMHHACSESAAAQRTPHSLLQDACYESTPGTHGVGDVFRFLFLCCWLAFSFFVFEKMLAHVFYLFQMFFPFCDLKIWFPLWECCFVSVMSSFFFMCFNIVPAQTYSPASPIRHEH